MEGWIYLGFFPLMSYCAGAIPFGYLAVRWLRGQDVRTLGSGNIGATNVARALGFPAALVVLLLDGAKGFLPVLAVGATASSPGLGQVSGALCGACAVLGHVYPCTLRFRGGKGVATGLGTLLALQPAATLCGLAAWVVVVALTRYVALGSIVAALAIPVAIPLVAGPAWRGTWVSMTYAAALAALVLWRHRTNVARMVAGKETMLFSKAFSLARRDSHE